MKSVTKHLMCLGWRGSQAIFCLLTMLPLVMVGQEPNIVGKASTSRASRDDAIRSIPFRNLSAEAQNRITSVVKNPTMFRRMPISVIQCDPEMHQFLVRYPEVVVSTWKIMGITQVNVERMAPYQLKCSDGVGTTSDMELIYGDHDTHVILCEGEYDGPMFRKPLRGRCVLLLKSGVVPIAEGFQMTNRLDVFLQVDHIGVDVFARTLHPLLGASADTNFLETMNFLQRMSQAASSSSNGMQHLAGRMQDIDPSVRQQFQNVVAEVSMRAERQLALRPPSSAPAGIQSAAPSDSTAGGVPRSTRQPRPVAVR